MGIDGEELDGVYGGNELLEKANHPDYKEKKVAVIGGGNVAMDTARTIKRLGAKEVKVIYRRAEKQMPAEKKEIQDAKNESIEFLFQTNIVKIMGDKKVDKIECIKTELVKKCREFARVHGSEILLTEDVEEGLANASAVYTDVWVSMGEADSLWKERIKLLTPYRVTKELMKKANPDAIFLHCLPSFHDTNTTIGKEIHEKFGVTEMEVTDEVFESKQSKVMDEAENRLHTIKAIMYATMKK